MKKFFDLTKFGIVSFVLFTSAGGYLIGHPFQDSFSVLNFALMLGGLYFLSSGSFALNQYQERDLDKKMPRTANRPLPSGRLTPKQALVFALSFLSLGLLLCLLVSWKVMVLGLATVVFYNYFYTLKWKRQSPFAAIPGAIPGAMPFVIGYTAATDIIFDSGNF